LEFGIDVVLTPLYKIKLQRIGGYSMETSYLNLAKFNNKTEFANIILYSFASLISQFGTYIYTFAIGLYVLKVTGSGLSFASNLVLGAIPAVILYPVAGVLADRFNRKALIVGMDILNGLLMILLYFISGEYGLNITMIYAATFIMTMFTTVFGISLEASIPNMVTEKRLMTVNSAARSIDASSSIIAPMVGGLVFAFIDIRLFILINGISFIFSGVSCIFINFKVNCLQAKNKERVKMLDDIKGGINYLKDKKEFISIILIFVFLNFFLALGVSVPLPFIINSVLKLSPKYFGMIQSALPLGIIFGALLVKRVSDRFEYKKMLWTTSIALSICMILLGLPLMLIGNSAPEVFYMAYYICVMLVLGFGISFVDIPIIYKLQRSISDKFRGRVLGLGLSLAKIASPLALIISGILTNHIHAFILPVSAGLLLFIVMKSLLKENA
jgi:MFS family permease